LLDRVSGAVLDLFVPQWAAPWLVLPGIRETRLLVVQRCWTRRLSRVACGVVGIAPATPCCAALLASPVVVSFVRRCWHRTSVAVAVVNNDVVVEATTMQYWIHATSVTHVGVR
jgi:hypothetical protein